MRSIALFVVTMLTLAGCAVAADPPMEQQPAGEEKPAPPVNGRLSPESSVDDILSALDARGKDLKDFTATVSLTDTDPTTADSTTRSGKVWFQNAKSGARIHVLLDKLTSGTATRDDKIEYLLDGQWLTERNYRRSQQVRRQVLQPGEQVNLLKLGEGPFPLPIGQPKEEVHKQFDVEKVADKDGDSAADIADKTVHVRLTPKADTRFAKKIATLDVWVDRESHMPRRIEVMEKNDTLRTTDLTEVTVNQDLGDDAFTLPAIDESWSQLEEKYQE